MYHSAGSTEQSWVSVDWAVATFGPSRLLYFLYPNARGFRPDLPWGPACLSTHRPTRTATSKLRLSRGRPYVSMEGCEG